MVIGSKKKTRDSFGMGISLMPTDSSGRILAGLFRCQLLVDKTLFPESFQNKVMPLDVGSSSINKVLSE